MTKKRHKRLSPRTIVDRLGMLRAAVADLQAQEETLRTQLLALGEKEVDGRTFHATVRETTIPIVDWNAVVAGLKPDKRRLNRLLRKYTHPSPRTAVVIRAR